MPHLFDPRCLPLLLAQEGANPLNPANPLSPLWMMLAIGVLFYLLMIRPERQRRSQQVALQAGLKKNDRVVTIGGIVGVVVNAAKDSPIVTLRVDEGNNTRLQVLRSSVSRVLADDDSPADAHES